MALIKKNKAAIAAIIVMFLIFFHYINVLKPLENVAMFLFAPIQKKLYSLSIKTKEFYNSSTRSIEKDELIKENIYLKDRLKEFEIKNVNLELIKTENKKLKELLDFLNNEDYAYITASVIGKNEGKNNILIINRGKKDGIKEGLAAVNSRGLVIGKIIKVNDITSHILFLNDDHSRIAGAILNYNDTAGVVEGDYGLSMKMNLIPQNVEIKAGDTIITSGLEPNIPYGLIIGKIIKVEKNEGDLFQNANIQQLFSLEDVQVVSVILPNK